MKASMNVKSRNLQEGSPTISLQILVTRTFRRHLLLRAAQPVGRCPVQAKHWEGLDGQQKWTPLEAMLISVLDYLGRVRRHRKLGSDGSHHPGMISPPRQQQERSSGCSLPLPPRIWRWSRPRLELEDLQGPEAPQRPGTFPQRGLPPSGRRRKRVTGAHRALKPSRRGPLPDEN